MIPSSAREAADHILQAVIIDVSLQRRKIDGLRFDGEYARKCAACCHLDGLHSRSGTEFQQCRIIAKCARCAQDMTNFGDFAFGERTQVDTPVRGTAWLTPWGCFERTKTPRKRLDAGGQKTTETLYEIGRKIWSRLERRRALKIGH